MYELDEIGDVTLETILKQKGLLWKK
jgi:hypothetical protein